MTHVTEARQFVVSTVEGWGLDPSDAGLVVSELAVNALVHAESPFTVTVSYERERLLIEVTDRGPGFVPDAPAPVIGMGLTIVDRLSTWGVRRHLQGGKTVWAELHS